MKNRLLIASTAILLALSPALRAEDAMPPKPAEKEKHTELGDQMDKMNKALKSLRTQVSDASKNASSLELLATIQKGTEASMKFKPETTAEKPAADQAKYVADYQAEMKKMIELLGKVEDALKANKNDEATKLVADVIAEEKSAHHDYRKPPKPKN